MCIEEVFEKTLRKLWPPSAAFWAPQDDLPDVATGVWVDDPLAAPHLCPGGSGGDGSRDGAGRCHLTIEDLDVDSPFPGAAGSHVS